MKELHLMKNFKGETNRSIGTHILNKESSRSHCIFTIRVESKSLTTSEEKYTLSKLNLVDLAGSERLNKTQVRLVVLNSAFPKNPKNLIFLQTCNSIRNLSWTKFFNKLYYLTNVKTLFAKLFFPT